jgi:hypothetical protein
MNVKAYNHLCVLVFQINEFSEPNGWPLISVAFGYKGLVATLSSSSTQDCSQLTIWMMDSFCKTTYLGHLQIPESGQQCLYSLSMDEHFVVVFQYCQNSGTVFVYKNCRWYYSINQDENSSRKVFLFIPYMCSIRTRVAYDEIPIDLPVWTIGFLPKLSSLSLHFFQSWTSFSWNTETDSIYYWSRITRICPFRI